MNYFIIFGLRSVSPEGSSGTKEPDEPSGETDRSPNIMK